MKEYDVGDWGISFIFSLEGSVILKTFAWALPSACVAFVISGFMHGFIDGDVEPVIEISDSKEYKDIAQLWLGFSFMIGFLITFRTGKAYSRWWEGATLLQQARGEWVNCFSNCIAFCSADPAKKGEVQNFREFLALLLSFLFSAALNAITQADNNFEVLQLVELPEETLEYLRECDDKVEVIICWIQTLIIQSMRKSVIDVPPPVLSRVFQELSRGIVNMKNVQKISVFLFPFPYAQLIGLLLLLFTILTPIVTGLFMVSYLNAFLTTFTSVFSLVALNFVAMEIECPFGTDPNDLPMQTMQQYMNRTLELLLEPNAYTVPNVDFARTQRNLDRVPKSSRFSHDVPFVRNTSPSMESHTSQGTSAGDSIMSPNSQRPYKSKRVSRQKVDFAPRAKKDFGRVAALRARDSTSSSTTRVGLATETSRNSSKECHEHNQQEWQMDRGPLWTIQSTNVVDFRCREGASADVDAVKADLKPVQEHEALSSPQTSIQQSPVLQRWPPTTPTIVMFSDKPSSFASNREESIGVDSILKTDMAFSESITWPPVTPKMCMLSGDGNSREYSEVHHFEFDAGFQESWIPEVAELGNMRVPEDESLMIYHTDLLTKTPKDVHISR